MEAWWHLPPGGTGISQKDKKPSQLHSASAWGRPVRDAWCQSSLWTQCRQQKSLFLIVSFQICWAVMRARSSRLPFCCSEFSDVTRPQLPALFQVWATTPGHPAFSPFNFLHRFLCRCIHVCSEYAPWACGPVEARGGIGSPGTGVKDTCELPGVSRNHQTQVLYMSDKHFCLLLLLFVCFLLFGDLCLTALAVLELPL